MSAHRIRDSVGGVFILLFGIASCVAKASDFDEYKIKRQEVFDFARKPVVTRNGDRVEIAFETKGYCDATVAIEDADGKIARHFASGVLGPNAPERFKKNSLSQYLVWDGKDDFGKYIDEKDKLTVRVSLGLKPRFERNFFWEPKRRLGSWEEGSILINTPTPLIQAAPEGVYVFEGRGVEYLRLFNHAGEYVRAVYPFPANKLKDVKGLEWHTLPQDGKSHPKKTGFAWATFLTSGSSCVQQGGAHGGGPSTFGSAATSMSVLNGRIALAFVKLNRLSRDGTTGGLPLEGPVVSYEQPNPISRALGPVSVGPTSAAFSPDGKWLYLTGYTWGEQIDTLRQYAQQKYLQGVARVPFEGEGKLETFAGKMNKDEIGSEPGKFTEPTSVACDPDGRVYVADYMNDRLQVFAADGKFLKAIACTKPARVRIHPKTREIYVFSWMLPTFNMKKAYEKQKIAVKATMTRLGTFDDPSVKATYPLPFARYSEVAGLWSYFGGLDFYVELNPYSDPPSLWLIGAPPKGFDIEGVGVQIYEIREKELVKRRDFSEEAARTLAKTRLPVFWRQRLYVNPASGKLYLTEGHTGPLGKMFQEMMEIDPDSGEKKLVQVPFDAEDIAFDYHGLFYIRDYLSLGRYNPKDWLEVPWDYGVERNGVTANSHSNRRTASLISAIYSYSGTGLHKGGIGLSPKGNMALTCYVTKDYPAPVSLRTDDKAAMLDGNPTRRNTLPGEKGWAEGNLYTPRFFPGRYYWGEVHIYDRHGKIIYDDAVPGIAELFGIALDRDDNVYTLSNLTRVHDGNRYWNPKSGTLMKFKPQKGRVLCNAQTGNVPVKLTPESTPKRPPDLYWFDKSLWVEGAEWKYGGVGFAGKNHICSCWNCRFALDFFARSFVPEMDIFSVAVLDTNGNLILRIGRYGNVEDGKPLIAEGGPLETRSLGGDEVGLYYGAYVAVHTDRRLYIADPGNQRLLSVKLGFHAEERLALKNVPDAARNGGH